MTYGVGFRVGAVVADNLLVYGRIGWVRTNVDATVTLAGVGSASGDEDFDGGRFGVGVEGMFAENIGVRGENTYTIYEEPSDSAGLDWDINQHLFRIGVAWYF